jgi:hypothetical protein
VEAEKRDDSQEDSTEDTVVEASDEDDEEAEDSVVEVFDDDIKNVKGQAANDYRSQPEERNKTVRDQSLKVDVPEVSPDQLEKRRREAVDQSGESVDQAQERRKEPVDQPDERRKEPVDHPEERRKEPVDQPEEKKKGKAHAVRQILGSQG